MEVIDGVGVVMLKLREADVAPPGACTLTEAMPVEVIRLAGTAALSCVADTNVVVNAEPFHKALSPLTKLPPFIVNVNDPPPAKAVVGEMEIKDGVGAVMLKPSEFEVTPPGACTATEADPGVESKLEGTVALNCVADPKVVLSAEPFHRTVSPLTKLLPVTVNAKVVPPATAVAGEMEFKDGVGAVMLKPREFEVAPPGA